MNETAVESSAKLVLDLNEKIRVLHVDDDSSFLKSTKQCIEMEAPVQVDTAISVEEASKKLEKERYDVIVSDYQMPTKDGLEFLKELRENGNTTPFIMFTGKGREEVAIKAINLGANQYLNKVGETGTVYAELAHSITELAKIKKEGEALRDSEEKYRTLVEQSLQGIVVAQGTALHLVFANVAMSKILGYAPEKLTSLSPEQTIALIHPEDRELFFGRFKDLLEGRPVPTDYEVRGIRKNGTVAWLELSSAKIEYNGQPAVQAAFIDITERKKAEETLRESEHRLRTYLDSIHTGILLVDAATHVILDANATTIRMFGGSKDQIVGSICHKFVCPAEKGHCPITDVGQNVDCSDRILMKANGEVLPIIKTVVPASLGDRKVLIESFIDVTDRKKAEEELRESEERYRELFESIQDPVCIYVGKEGRLIDYNTAFKRFFGYTDEELKGKVFLYFVHPDDQAMVLQKYQARYPAEEFPIVYEIRVMNKKGESIPLEISVSTYKRKGRAIGIEVVHRDITERKRYEENLSALNTHGRDLNMAKSMEEVYELTLDAAEKTLGFEFADMSMVEGKTLRVVAHRGYFGNLSLELPLDGDKGITVRTARTGKPVLVQDISKDGAYVGVGLQMRSELAVPIKIGHRVLGVLNVEREKLNAFNEKDQELLEILASHAVTAISNLDHANEVKTYTLEIEETKTKFEGLFLGNPEAAVYLGPDFHIQDINPRFRELFGYSLAEVKGKHINDVVVPNGKMEEAQTLDDHAIEGYARQNTLRRRKDGSLVPVSASAAPITVKDKVIGYMAVYIDDTERKRYEENLSALNTHGRDLNMAKSMEEVYELTLDAMRKTLGFEYTRFMTIEKNNLVIACHRGHTRPVVPNLPIDGTRGITVRAIKTREPVLVQDVSKDEDYVAALSGIQSELAVPVLAEDRVLGVLDVESRKLAAFSEKDVTLLQILASHAATAISNLLQRREIEKRSNHMASLMKSSAEMIHTADLRRRLQTIAEAIKEFGWRRIVISVRDENLEMRSPDDLVAVGVTDEEREFLWKNRPPGHVIREHLGPDYERFKIGEFYYIPWNDPWVKEKYGYKTSVLSHLKSEEMVDWYPQDTVYAPLRLADGRIVGRLSMDDPVDGRRPTKETLMPLELFLHQAAVAIENAQLIQQLAHARAHAEAYAREIRESQQKFERLFVNNPEASVYTDSSFHILDINPRFCELFGYSLHEVKGRDIDDVMVPKDKMHEAKMLREEFMKGPIYCDTVRQRKDGTLVPVSISAAPIIVGDQLIGHVGLYKDITERKRYEERLSALNIYSRDLNMAESIEEIYRLTLDAMQKVLGFEYADFFMIDKSVLCIVDQRGYPEPFPLELPLDGSKKGICIKVVKTGNSVIVQDVRKNTDFVEGLPSVLSELAVPIRVGQETFGVLNVESKKLNAFDEKDRALLEILASHAATAISNSEYAKNLEAAATEIRESQQRFERLFMDNPEAAVYTDSSFCILNANPRFIRLFGYSLDEIRGSHINDVVVPKGKMEEARAFDERARKGEAYQEDTVRKRKDGSLVPVAFSAAPIVVENQVVGHMAVYKDISQLKKVEEELRQTLEKLARMNEKLRVIGGLTRHDARNKLGAITGHVYLAKKKLVGSDEVLNNLREIESTVAQMVRIFEFAKTYEMLGVEELRFIDVERMVDEAVSLFSDLKGVKAANECHGLTVLADSLLRQLFYNLIDNSLKYGDKIAHIRVHFEESEDWLRLIYEDDGVGISQDAKPRIFGEGYTSGKGSGYGLYLIKKMMEVYGWTIEEAGEPGKGVRFVVTIPKTNGNGKENYRIA